VKYNLEIDGMVASRELCFVHACSGLSSPEMTTRPRVEEQLSQAYTLTLGDVTGKLEGILPAVPAELVLDLRKLVEY
jgi:hypothetical protein